MVFEKGTMINVDEGIFGCIVADDEFAVFCRYIPAAQEGDDVVGKMIYDSNFIVGNSPELLAGFEYTLLEEEE